MMLAFAGSVSEPFQIVGSPSLERRAKTCPLLDDQASREAWVVCCTQRFLPLARRLAGDNALAEDALQESWSRILTQVCRYRGAAPACGWVGKIVANCAHDVRVGSRGDRLRQDAHLSDNLVAGTSSPESQVLEREMLALLQSIVEALPATYREVYILRYRQECSERETARHLGISPTAVSSRLNRAVKLIQERLAQRLGRMESNLRT